MSIRCAIAKGSPRAGYKWIYCHNDGSPAGVGQTLATYYTSPAKIEALLRLGNISSLGANLEYRLPGNPSGTVDYGRWRGDFEPKKYADDAETLMHRVADYGVDYVYIWDDDEGAWFTKIVR